MTRNSRLRGRYWRLDRKRIQHINQVLHTAPRNCECGHLIGLEHFQELPAGITRREDEHYFSRSFALDRALVLSTVLYLRAVIKASRTLANLSGLRADSTHVIFVCLRCDLASSLRLKVSARTVTNKIPDGPRNSGSECNGRARQDAVGCARHVYASGRRESTCVTKRTALTGVRGHEEA